MISFLLREASSVCPSAPEEKSMIFKAVPSPRVSNFPQSYLFRDLGRGGWGGVGRGGRGLPDVEMQDGMADCNGGRLCCDGDSRRPFTLLPHSKRYPTLNPGGLFPKRGAQLSSLQGVTTIYFRKWVDFTEMRLQLYNVFILSCFRRLCERRDTTGRACVKICLPLNTMDAMVYMCHSSWSRSRPS